MLTSEQWRYEQCEVTNVAGGKGVIEAGIWPTTRDSLKVAVMVGGSVFDLPHTEFARLQLERKAKRV
jgi:hypothetical protein